MTTHTSIMPVPRLRSRRGILSFDVATGMALGLVLLMMISAVVVKQRSAENRLAATRAATRAAETALLQLRAGQGASVGQVQRLTDAAPAGHAWVRLTVQAGDRKPGASIVGLVPVAHLQDGARQ